jgi:hypothetical protein
VTGVTDGPSDTSSGKLKPMPKKKSTSDSSTPVDEAKAIGTTAGKVASLVGTKFNPEPRRKSAKGKLPKKNKDRLPRKEKKAARKQTLASP